MAKSLTGFEVNARKKGFLEFAWISGTQIGRKSVMSLKIINNPRTAEAKVYYLRLTTNVLSCLYPLQMMPIHVLRTKFNDAHSCTQNKI